MLTIRPPCSLIYCTVHLLANFSWCLSQELWHEAEVHTEGATGPLQPIMHIDLHTHAIYPNQSTYFHVFWWLEETPEYPEANLHGPVENMYST